MKVWSDTLTHFDLSEAVNEVNREHVGANLMLLSAEGPWNARKRKWRYDNVRLAAYAGNRHRYTTYAGYAFHGWWMLRLFARDPNARVLTGMGDYDGLDAFHRITDYDFVDPRSPRERQMIRALRMIPASERDPDAFL